MIIEESTRTWRTTHKYTLQPVVLTIFNPLIIRQKLSALFIFFLLYIDCLEIIPDSPGPYYSAQ